MKNLILSAFIACFSCSFANAQFHDGKICPNVTIEFLDSSIQSLYTILDSGKIVYLFIYDSWSEESWDYHQSDVLQNFHNNHSAVGDDKVRVIAVPNSSYYAILGLEEISQGNWVANTPYPIVHPDVESEYNSAYALVHLESLAVVYWELSNSVIKICPDRHAYKLGLPTYQELTTSLETCQISTQGTDAQIVYADMDSLASCSGQTRSSKAYLSNMGSQTLTSCNVVLSDDGQTIQTYHWLGSLETYQLDTIVLNNWTADGTASKISLYPNNPNGVADQNPSNDTLNKYVPHAEYWDSDTIFVEVQADGYGHQIYWDIVDAMGVTIDSGGNESVGETNGINAGNSQNEYQDFEYEYRSVPISAFATECITVRVLSGWGYGTCCTWGNGYIRFIKGGETVFEFKDFGRRGYGRLSTVLVPTNEAIPISHLKAYPNPTDNNIMLSFGLANHAKVSIEVFSVLGQRLATISTTLYPSGRNEVLLSVATWPEGIYWAVLRSEQGSQAVKFVVAR